MFSGLGSFSDLNSTFAQLTNTLSLDALQQTNPAETTDPTQTQSQLPGASNVEKKSLEAQEVAAAPVERKVVKQFTDQMVQFVVSSVNTLLPIAIIFWNSYNNYFSGGTECTNRRGVVGISNYQINLSNHIGSLFRRHPSS